eukprot:5152673-Heterocapsa_arctica.AAC.1
MARSCAEWLRRPVQTARWTTCRAWTLNVSATRYLRSSCASISRARTSRTTWMRVLATRVSCWACQ